MAKQYFRRIDKFDTKSDDSPVTIADKLIEKKLREILETEFPTHAIYGEEYGGSLGSGTGWCIDPIDGTRAFIAGKPIFGTLVAFCNKGFPLLGLIDMPCLDEMYIGYFGESLKYSSATLNGTVISASKKIELSEALIATSSPAAFTELGFEKFQIISEKCKDTYFGGDCHNYALLASGHIDIVMEHKLAPYDMMALVPILLASGAVVTDWSGQPIKTQNVGEILAASTAELHANALSLLKA
ncbi:MAG: inositol monophosphatase family protein [Alphaproteobacteria bacterium]